MRTILAILFTALTALPTVAQSFGTFSDVGYQGSRIAGALASGSTVNTITNDITAYWRMDDEASWSDETPNNLDLNENGSVGTTTGIITNAVDFTTPSTSNWLSIADNDLFSAIESNAMTFCMWLAVDTTNVTHYAIAKYAASNGNREWRAGWSSTENGFFFSIYTNTTSASEVTVNTVPTGGAVAGTWYFVSAIIDPTNMVSKVRHGYGASLSEWTTSAQWQGWGYDGSGTNGGQGVQIGKSVISTYDGKIDEVGIWRRALTDTEITNLFNSGNGLTYPFQ